MPGEIVYLQRKARKGEQDFYTVKPGETMRSISQKLGIRINKLYYRNRLKDGENPKEGTTLWLRKRKPSSN
jgi:membrane-bound lytic murein transglycosylase D